MGTQQSKAILGTPEQYQIQQQKRRQQNQVIRQSQSFFKIQPCYYPHSLMQRHSLTQKNNKNHTRCTRKHDKFHDSYNLCTQCERKPQKITKNNKIFYEKSTYKQEKPQPQYYEYNDVKFKQKQILAPGPQVPGFYNGFSLPVDRYYKQKTQISDNIEPIKGSIYRQENKQIQQSIYEQRPERYSRQAQQIEIDYEGFQQNLRF